MKTIVTIIPTYVVTNSFLPLFLSFFTNQRQKSSLEKVGDLVKRTIFVFLFIARRALLQSHGEFWLLWRNFFTCYSCSYYSSMQKFSSCWQNSVLCDRSIFYSSFYWFLTGQFCMKILRFQSWHFQPKIRILYSRFAFFRKFVSMLEYWKR